MKKIILFIFFASIMIGSNAYAHKPRLASDKYIKVEKPEVSQAFYGELSGEPVEYKIESDEAFDLYVGILVPDLPDIDKDVSARIYKKVDSGLEVFFELDGIGHAWPAYYEEHAGDDYFWGPEFKSDDSQKFMPKGEAVEAGVYIVKVYSPDNLGKYVFVVGEKEEFSFSEIIETFKVLTTLKSDFFGKSKIEAFTNRIGLYVVVPLFVIVLLIIMIVRFFIKRRK